MFYEDKIDTMDDALGWMLETFDTDAIDRVDDWLLVDPVGSWYVDLHELRKELEKIITEQ